MFYDASEGDLRAEEYVVEEDSQGDEERSMTDTAADIDSQNEDQDTPASEREIEDMIASDSGVQFNDENAVQRRTSLPAATPNEEGSLFGILKKNVGQVSVTHCA